MQTDIAPPPDAAAPLIEWALWAAAMGQATRAVKVFPVVPRGKRPRDEGWQSLATWDREAIGAEWTSRPDSNIGLAIQPGAIALDADIYKAGHEDALHAFEAEYGALPPTLEFCSARGGFHLIYATTRHLGNSTGDLPKFGDVRGHGGYLVGPGSTFEGQRYTVAELRQPVALPGHVEACIRSRRANAAAARELPQGVVLDDPVNAARFTIWLLTTAKPSVEGQGGNNALAATGAMGASYGLSEGETTRLMELHWNARCSPPWDEEDLHYHAGSGYRTSTSVFGNMASVNAQALGFKPVVAGEPLAVPAHDLWRTMADIAGPAPAREWAAGTDADGWVPLGGVTFLYGPGGVGKTALVGQWALSQARGEPLFGVIPTRKMPVVLIAAEDDADEMHRRFEKQGRRPDDDVTFAAVRGRDTALHPPFRQTGAENTWLFELITHKLVTMPAGPKLLILDNLAQIYQGNYYEPAEIIKFLNGYLGRISEQFDATILVLAHPSEGQRASGDGGYGGVQWSAGVRARLYFERHMTVPAKKGDKPAPIGRERLLSRKKANYADDSGKGLVLDWSDWSFVPVVRAPPPMPFTPVNRPPRGESVAEAAVLPIVQRACEQVMASNPSRKYSSRQLSLDASHLLGQGPNKMSAERIRAAYLSQMVEAGHPAYRRDGGGGWRHAAVN